MFPYVSIVCIVVPYMCLCASIVFIVWSGLLQYVSIMVIGMFLCVGVFLYCVLLVLFYMFLFCVLCVVLYMFLCVYIVCIVFAIFVCVCMQCLCFLCFCMFL